MSNDYDDIDETADPVDDDSEDDTESLAAGEADGEEGEPAAASGESDAPITRSEADDAETLTVSSKEALRRQLEEEMERFLAQGGKIKEIPADESADPPRKPTSSYGSKPI